MTSFAGGIPPRLRGAREEHDQRYPPLPRGGGGTRPGQSVETTHCPLPAPLGPAPSRAARARRARGERELPGGEVVRGTGTLRRELYRLRDGLRWYAERKRVRGCGRVRVRPRVDVMTREGRANYGGLLRCGSVWECPTCGAAIKSERAEMVRAAVEAHGIGRVVLLTLAVRHGLGHDVKLLRSGVANAWRKMQAGAPWGRFREKVGLVGSVRALETTEGRKHGFHPHLHILLFTKLGADSAEWRELEAWIALRWIAKVEAVLGASNRPTRKHGAKLTPCHSANYIAKLGLEVSAPGTKKAKRGHRTPLDIAAAACAEPGRVPAARDVALWQSYARGFFRARMLTWSKGLRARLGVTERSEADILEAEGTGELVTYLDAKVWDKLRDARIQGRNVKVRILEAAESGGAAAVEELIAPYAIAAQRADRAKPPPPPRPELEVPELPPLLDEGGAYQRGRDLEWEYDNHEALERMAARMRVILGDPEE